MPDDTLPPLEPPVTTQATASPAATPPSLGAAMADGGAAATRLVVGWLGAWSDLAVLPHDLARELLDCWQRSRLLAMAPKDGRDLADPLGFYGRSVEAAFADFDELHSRLVERMAECGRRLDRHWREETAEAADALIAARHEAQAIAETPPL